MSRIRVNSIKPISGQIVSLSGSLIVTGDVTAEQFITEKVQTSIIYRSGSTLFGDSADDLHNFTGSVFVSGGLDSSSIASIANTNLPNGELLGFTGKFSQYGNLFDESSYAQLVEKKNNFKFSKS